MAGESIHHSLSFLQLIRPQDVGNAEDAGCRRGQAFGSKWSTVACANRSHEGKSIFTRAELGVSG
jgi:hypothetical protein